MSRHLRRACLVVAVLVSIVLTPSLVAQQQSKSAALASELAKLLDARKLDSIGARLVAPDQYVGALYFPGSQLLVIKARYLVPPRMDLYIEQKNYRDVYLDLNSASVPESKVFISDLGANGLQFDRRNDTDPFDTVDRDGRSFTFNGDWGRQRLSRDEYTKAYQATEADYVVMLEALIAEAKKGA